MTEPINVLFKPKPDSLASGEDSFGYWLKENLEAVLVAFVMALIIRCFCIEVFKIPTGSMEPTLMGNERNGDRIMVAKFLYALHPVERFDVMVFKYPLDLSRNFIKRVVGLPNERFQIEAGDIYTAPLSGGEFTIARKPLWKQQAIWLPWTWNVSKEAPESFLRSPRDFERFWRAPDGAEAQIRDGVLTLAARGAGPAMVAFKDRVVDRDGNPVGDLRLRFDATPGDGPVSVRAFLQNGDGSFSLTLATEGSAAPGELFWQGARGERETRPVERRLRPGRGTDVQFMFCDGVATVLLDGEKAAEQICRTTLPSGGLPSWQPALRFGAEGGVVEFRDLELRRDIHYVAMDNFQPGLPREIGPDRYVVMGDNVPHSSDSRMWQMETVTLEGGAQFQAESLRNGGGQRRRDPDGTEAVRDVYGNEWIIAPGSFAERSYPVPAPYVEARHVVGKAFLVWWPPGRWFRIIR